MEKSGSWFAYNGQKIGQGKDNAKAYLKEHPEVRDEIEEKIRSILSSKEGEVVEETADVDADSDDDILGIDI